MFTSILLTTRVPSADFSVVQIETVKFHKIRSQSLAVSHSHSSRDPAWERSTPAFCRRMRLSSRRCEVGDLNQSFGKARSPMSRNSASEHFEETSTLKWQQQLEQNENAACRLGIPALLGYVTVVNDSPKELSHAKDGSLTEPHQMSFAETSRNLRPASTQELVCACRFRAWANRSCFGI